MDKCHICKGNIDGHFHLDDNGKTVYPIPTIFLNKEDGLRFLEALEKPSEPTEALKEAMRKYNGNVR